MIECVGIAFIVAKMTCREVGPAPAPTGQARFCLTYKPVTWSPKDTPQTVLQNKQNNARFVELCRPKVPTK